VLPKKVPLALDCEACGACCCNSEPNKHHAFRDYVEVTSADVLWKRQEKLFSLAVLNAVGETHLKLVGREQRCVALSGKVGEQVGCTIYALRPTPCRDLQAGSLECLERRKEKKLPIARGAWKAARARSTRWGA
jgi:Fe-S-cluster containining protein